MVARQRFADPIYGPLRVPSLDILDHIKSHREVEKGMRDAFVLLASQCYSALDRRDQLLVLTYHIATPEERITHETIERDLVYLRQHYKLITPSQWNGFGESRRVAMVIVDDGHISAYETIFPVARKLAVPITIAVPTDFVFRGKWLWFYKVSWIISRLPFEIEVSVADRRFTLSSLRCHKSFLEVLKHISAVDREAKLNELIAASGIDVPDQPVREFSPVTVDQLREMLASDLVELSAHSVTHPIMTSLSDVQLRVELTQPKEELEEFCGSPVVSFCYPNGGPGDFDSRTRSALADAGYRVGFTTIEGLNRPNRTNLLELKRIHAHTRYAVFRKLASGLGDLQRGLGLLSED